MSERERARTDQAPADAAFGSAPEQCDDASASSDSLLRAADTTIARVLSENSERFLGAVRQSGGQ